MLRVIEQNIEAYPKVFAIFNTVNNCFVMYNDVQIWDCWEDLEEDMRGCMQSEDKIKRVKRLVPDSYKEADDA